MTGLLPVLEVLLVVCGLLAVLGTVHAVNTAHRERLALQQTGRNGRLRLVAWAQIVRQSCRLVAAVATFLGGLLLIWTPPGVPLADVIAKTALAIDAVALTGTVLVDVWVRYRVTGD